MRNTAICPNCGAEQKGLILKETKGSVVCNNCETKFEVEIEEQNEPIEETKKNKATEGFVVLFRLKGWFISKV
ncbi:MAG: hypothetical protein K2L12_04355 [Clostridia bacterium]|nr:hypothetical protein [Clostridia bacterium]